MLYVYFDRYSDYLNLKVFFFMSVCTYVVYSQSRSEKITSKYLEKATCATFAFASVIVKKIKKPKIKKNCNK